MDRYERILDWIKDEFYSFLPELLSNSGLDFVVFGRNVFLEDAPAEVFSFYDQFFHGFSRFDIIYELDEYVEAVLEYIIGEVDMIFYRCFSSPSIVYVSDQSERCLDIPTFIEYVELCYHHLRPEQRAFLRDFYGVADIHDFLKKEVKRFESDL